MATLRFLVLVAAIIAAAMFGTSMALENTTVVYDNIRTEFIFKWHGGFIGSIEIPITEDLDGWNMTITFPRAVYDFEICPAEVVDIVNRRVVHLQNKPWKCRTGDGEDLEMWFNARTWRKIRGLVGIIHFEGRIKPEERNETESSEDQSSSAMGYNNSVACEPVILNQNNVTCGSYYEVISGSGIGPYVAEVRIPVDFSDTEATVIDLTTNIALIFITLESNGFNNRFQPLDGGPAMTVTGFITTKGPREHIFNLNDEEFENEGEGMLFLRFRFATSSTPGEDGPILFPYLEGTVECLCTRLLFPVDFISSSLI